MALFNIDDRIEIFTKKIKSARSKSDIDRLCKSEFKYLQAQGYSPNSIRKFFTKYRKVVLSNYTKGSRKYNWIYGSSDKQKIESGEVIRGLLIPIWHQSRLDGKQKRVIEKRTKSNSVINRLTGVKKGIGTKSDFPKVKNLDKYIRTAKALLKTNNWQNIAVGLIALTGRRSTEIVKTGSFEAVDTFVAHFDGQLKKKGNKNDLDIVVLCESDLIVKALDKLRRLKDCSGWTNEQAKDNTNGTINRTIKRNFEQITDLKGLTAHDLRRIYVEVVYQRYMIMENDFEINRLNTYVAALGDYDLEAQEIQASDKKAAMSYIKYQLDNEGKQYIKNNLI
ncbi:MAG: protelomerase family protein [Polaribacter sp.]